jgi:hypothetical protein
VCDENRRKQLIAQRERLLEQQATGREVEAAAPVALPAPETQSNANAGAVNGIVAQDQSHVTQPDPVFQHMESISRADSWGESQHNGAMFGPYPEELE